jgi:hypothetical protein
VVQKTGTRKEASVQVDETEGIVNLDRTRCLDEVMARVIAATDPKTLPEHAFTFPMDIRGVPDFYSHLIALLRVTEEHAGVKVAVYVSAGDDHYGHAENYCRVAMAIPRPVPLADQRKLETMSQWD